MHSSGLRTITVLRTVFFLPCNDLLQQSETDGSKLTLLSTNLLLPSQWHGITTHWPVPNFKIMHPT